MLKSTCPRSIDNFMEKIKQFIGGEKGKDILTVLVVILVGLGSFELGRLSKEASNTGVRVQYPSQDTGQSANSFSLLDHPNVLQSSKVTTTKNFFASSRGSKYYSVGCSGGKTIKQENRIYFTTSAEAEQAGYKLSSSCR